MYVKNKNGRIGFVLGLTLWLGQGLAPESTVTQETSGPDLQMAAGGVGVCCGLEDRLRCRP